MYYFEAEYINMDTNESTVRKIQIEDQFCDNEKQVYLIAMSMAYDATLKNECFAKFEFIAC